MKDICRKIGLLVLMITLGYPALPQSGWTNPSGDAGQPFLEIWVYGATTPDGTLEAGDQIAAFDGTKLVGLITLTVTPDIMNWNSTRLLAYNKNTSGEQLYTPGNPLTIKCWDASENKITDAFTWGDGKQIDFHNQWYAPTSDIQATAATYGAYFPLQSNSYCYVNITSSEDAAEYATLVVSLLDNSEVPQPVTGATISADGNTAVEGPDGTYTLELYAGYDIVPAVDYNYRVYINADGFDNEKFDICVHADNNNGNGYQETVYLNTFGVVEGMVDCYSISTGMYDSIPVGADVIVDVMGVTYTGTVDTTGYYIVDGIPDGIWPMTISFAGYDDDQSTAVIPLFDTLVYDASLEPHQGTIHGRIYNATTMMAVEDEVIRVALHDTLGVEQDFVLTDANGEYELSHYPGVYNIVVSDENTGTSPDYQPFTSENHVMYPETDDEMDFYLVPDPYIPHFDTIFGDEDYVWNIKVEMAKFGINFTVPFDELVIFDVDQDPDPAYPDEPGKRVGVLHFTEIGHYQYASTNVLKTYGQFEDGSQGFIESNNMEIWGYDVSHDAVYSNPTQCWFNTGNGNYSGNTFPDPQGGYESFLIIYWESVTGILTGTVDNLTAPGTPVADATVEVLDYYSNEVIYSGLTDDEGKYKIFADQGLYNIRYSKPGLNMLTRYEVTIIQDEITELDVHMDSQDELNITYSLEDQGFYFIGRAIVQYNSEMLGLLDNVDPGNDMFSASYLNSWVENDEQQALTYNTGAFVWEPDDYQWDIDEGYLVYTEQPYEFSMQGYLVAPSMSAIDFPSAGIYYIPYYPYSADESSWDEAIVAFESIFDNLDWVMDSRGNRLHHDNGEWIDNIGTLSPAEGYKVKMNGPTTLTYPVSSGKGTKSGRIMLEPVHFVYSGGNAADWTYTIYINTDEFDIGDEIAAYSNGIMVGSMVIDSDIAWENDLNMFVKAVNGGYEINSLIELSGWDASENKEYIVDFEMIDINESAYIGNTYPAGLDHFSYINLYKETVEVHENQVSNLLDIFPNPTSGILNINSSLLMNEVSVYNIHGVLVSSTSVLSHDYKLQLSGCVPGLYLIRVNTVAGVITKQVIVK